MAGSETRRTGFLGEIAARQRQATELSIEVKLEAAETEDPRILEEASKTMQSAVHELEHARRMLVESHSTRVWGPDLRGIYTTVFG